MPRVTSHPVSSEKMEELDPVTRCCLPSLFPIPALVVMLTAFAVIAPFFFFHGTPSGHDFEFHMYSWMEVLGQWKQGILYPRWASLAHWGYGEARFLFYPPASWMLGATIGALLPWRFVPNAFIWLALCLSGCSMFLLARRCFRRSDAVFAAALYTANPYYLVIVYWRSAYAELLAGALLPLLLLLVLQIPENGRKVLVPLSLVVAAAWLTNAPSAVMLNYSLALLVAVLAIRTKSPRILGYGLAAVLLGAALACFYLVPAAYEQRWVNLAEVFSPGVRPRDNFLFTTLSDPDHNQFNLLVSVVAVMEMIALAGMVWLSRKRERLKGEIWWASVAWTGAAALLLFRFTFIFWEYLPKLKFVQLPWRWLLCLNAVLVLFTIAGARRWFNRVAVCLAMLFVLASVWHRVLPPWWDEAPDIQEMQDAMASGQGYEGTDEYVPAGDDPYELNKDAAQVTAEAGGGAQIRIESWLAQEKRFRVGVDRPTTLVLRLFDYPAWQVQVNGAPVPAGKTPVTGQMTIALNAGVNEVQVLFLRTWDRTLGALLSLLAVLLVICYLVMNRTGALST